MIEHITVKEMKNPHVFRDHPLAHQYCTGQGLELGAAAHNPFRLPGSRNVAPFSDDPADPDFADFELYRDAQVSMCGAYARIDIVADACDLKDVANCSQDYIISSHVIEHIANPVLAILEADRVLKKGGIWFCIFPKRGAHPPDRHREIATPEFLWKIFADKLVPDAEQGHRGHYHVYTLQSMIDLIDFIMKKTLMRWELVHTEETDSKVGNGHTVIARKIRDIWEVQS